MCSRDCYKVFGYFLGFIWIVTACYYTMETIELLKLMQLRCTNQAQNETLRIQFDEDLVQKVCDFYGHLADFRPYHIITAIIKMVPGILLIVGILRSNITLVQVFIVYAVLEEIFFVIVFSKLFTLINAESKRSSWIFWILVFSCAKLILAIWIILGVYAAIDNSRRNVRRIM